jgi:hypothetical protein
MSSKTWLSLLLVGTVAVIALAACGGDGDTAGSQGSPTPVSQTPTERGSIAPATYCQVTISPAPELNLDVSARWKDDHIVVEGSADIPGPVRFQAWVCQDGEMTVALQAKGQPEIKNGKIKAEWEKKDVEVGPVFDPDSAFEVVLSVTTDPIGLPYFIVRIPVEGHPD